MLNNKAQNRCYMQEFTVSSANTWEYKTITYPGDTTGTWLHGNTDGVQLNWCFASGTNYQGTANQWNTSWKDHTSNQVNFMATSGNKIRFTGIQLEVGSVASPFEHRSFSEELARCQRYYYQNTAALYLCNYGSNAINNMFHPVQMRSTPTVSETTTSGNLTSISQITNLSCYYYAASVSGSAGTGIKAEAEL